MVYAQLSSPDYPTLKSKIGYSVLALFIMVFLPWLFFLPSRRSKAKRKAKRIADKEKMEERVKQGLPAKEPLTRVEKWQRVFKYGMTALFYYYLFLVVSVFIPGVIKQLTSKSSPLNQPDASSKQLSEVLGSTFSYLWDYTKEVFSTQQIGKVLLVIVVSSVFYRLVQFSLFIQRKVNKKSKT